QIDGLNEYMVETLSNHPTVETVAVLPVRRAIENASLQYGPFLNGLLTIVERNRNLRSLIIDNHFNAIEDVFIVHLVKRLMVTKEAAATRTPAAELRLISL